MERVFDAAKYGAFADEPVIEATIPSLADPSLVEGATGGHARPERPSSAAPYALRDGGWDDQRDRLGDAVIRTLGDLAPGLGARVTARQVLTPLDLERDFGLTGGHPLHVEPGAGLVLRLAPAAGPRPLPDAAGRPVPGRVRARIPAAA